MTCPTCQGTAVTRTDPPTACPLCYATGKEPSAAVGAVIAARLRIRSAIQRECAVGHQAPTRGTRDTLTASARTLAAALRVQGHPTREHDQLARLMVGVLLSVGCDPFPFVGWVKPFLNTHTRLEITARLARYVPNFEELTGFLEVRDANH